MLGTSLVVAVLTAAAMPANSAAGSPPPPDDLAAVHAHCTSDHILHAYVLGHDAMVGEIYQGTIVIAAEGRSVAPEEFARVLLAETFNPAEATVTIGGAGDDRDYGMTEGRFLLGLVYDCLTEALAMPERVQNHVAATRALDGIQQATWSGYSAQWTYHPDDGLNITIWVTNPTDLPLETVPPITLVPSVTLVPPLVTTATTTEPAIAPNTTAGPTCFAILQANNPSFAAVVSVAQKQSSIAGTVLAPSNSAVDVLPEAVRTHPVLAAIFVQAHIIGTPMTAQELEDAGSVATISGHSLTISGSTISGPSGSGSITVADQACANGFVHEIEGVLSQPEA